MVQQKPVRVFKTKLFARFSRKNSIDNFDLWNAVNELAVGSIDANLGSGVFKQRIARSGSGKSGGFRTIILFRHNSAAFFVYGFAKKDAANIDASQLQQFRKLAHFLLAQNDEELREAVNQGNLIEVIHAKKEIHQ
jgi:hypothetical protein